MKENIQDYKLAEDSFGYLMYLLYKNKAFSELHIPSLNLIKKEGSEIKIIKKVPIRFKNRIKEIKSVVKYSTKTNIKIEKEWINKSNLKLRIGSKWGKLMEGKDLNPSARKKIINLFFEYHKEINNKHIKVNTDYYSYFNKHKFKADILEIKSKMHHKNLSQFDKKVLNYLELISSEEGEIDYTLFKRCYVHGDFTLNNIIKSGENLSLIDLDMLHTGYLEIQLVNLLSELFSFSTKEFFQNLKKCYKSFSLNKKASGQLFEAYLTYKIFNLSVIKSAYFTDNTKYLSLQDYILSQINFIIKLIKQRAEFSKKFNQI